MHAVSTFEKLKPVLLYGAAQMLNTCGTEKGRSKAERDVFTHADKKM